MWKRSLRLGSCLGLGLLAGVLIAGTIELQTLPEPDLSANPAAEIVAVLETEDPAHERERSWIRSEAERLVDEYMAEVWTELEIDAGAAEYAPEVHILVDAADSAKWVTVSSARVPCSTVDRYLRERGDLAAGSPDRCKRWLRAAQAIIEAEGIEDRSPRELLKELAANQSVRVLLVYAGWQADTERDGEPKLVAAQAAYVYPQRDFAGQRDLAQNTVFRRMKLGPYSAR